MANKKVKKITNKEFKRVFTECYGDFECWGYEGILCLITLALTHKIENYKHSEADMTTLLILDSEKRDKIWKYLTEIGYFD